MEEKRPKLKTVLTGRTPAQRQAAERRRLDPAMRMLKAFHSVTAPEGMTAEELEKQRKGQELLGNLAADAGTYAAGGKWNQTAGAFGDMTAADYNTDVAFKLTISVTQID